MRFEFLNTFRRWLLIKKTDVRGQDDLYFYYTKRVLVILALFLFLSFSLAMTFISCMQEGEIKVSVPDLTGLPLVDGLLALQERNLYAEVKPVADFENPAGLIVDQEPKGGFDTREKRTILVLVSQHSKPGETPNLIGMGLDEAGALVASLSNTNFQPSIGRVSYAYSDTVPAGRIVGQQPPPGSILHTSFTIDLLLSKGSESLAIVLTNFSGMTPDEAITWLSFNHLTAAFLPTPGAAADRIAGQDPSPGTPLNQGAQVRLRIGGEYKYGVFDYIFPLYLKLAQVNLAGQRELAETATATNTNARPDTETDERAAIERTRANELQRSLLREGTHRYRVSLIRIEGSNRAVLFQGEKAPGERLLVSFRYDKPVTLEMQIDGKRFIRKEYR